MGTAVYCCRIHRAVPLLSLAALALLVLLGFLNRPTVRNPLDGCEFVYLDMGTNTGVQIRKLYESSLFPGAGVLPIFERYFGPAAGRNLSRYNIFLILLIEIPAQGVRSWLGAEPGPHGGAGGAGGGVQAVRLAGGGAHRDRGGGQAGGGAVRQAAGRH